MCWRPVLPSFFSLGVLLAFVSAPVLVSRDDSQQILSIDHYVPHISTVPSIARQTVQLYVRERVQAGVAAQKASLTGKVVLFVHGSNLPSENVFDLAHQDYSWMAYLAQAGLDAFGMDLTGFGLSTRPAPMEDPCNVSPDQQALLIPAMLSAGCSPSYPYQLGTIASSWDDIDQVVDYVRALRNVSSVSFIAWSSGGPWAGGYAAQHPEKVDKLILLAPVYRPDDPSNPPAQVPAAGVPMTIGAREGFPVMWDQQVQCQDQFDPAIRDKMWAEMLESDPVGAGWGPGVRRGPTVTNSWGWNSAQAARVQAPTLVVSGELDAQTPDTKPAVVRQLYNDIGASHKVFLDMACTSHFAIFESHHMILFDASLEWLQRGSVNGMSEGSLRLGD
jgi:pimeloyl-ACP methyl ester carboxylesterase